MINFLHTLASL